MANNPAELILFSSDSNVQYEKDIYNVIALPFNGKYRFRYKAEYVDPQSIQYLDKEVTGKRVLIAFRTNSASEEEIIEPFVVPIRWAVLDNVQRIDKIYIINFTAKDYPVFSSEFETASQSNQSNIEFSKKFFSISERNKIFVSSVMPNLALPEESSNINSSIQEKAWIRIIEALSQHNIFKRQFFFKTIIPINPTSNALEMKENQRSEIEIVHYNSDDKSDISATVNIQYDSDVMTSVFGEQERIECRYDKNSFPFIPKYINQEVDTQITFNIKTDNTEKETKIRIPVKIKRSNKRRWIRAGISFLGAFLLGIGSVLNCLSTPLKAVLFILGSAIVAATWLFSKGE